ncbi:MAG: hypothetical protein K8F91_09955 [Candidatus Obscuribacterales bacterium]|nr:hypothetical protein [Candidatus Obscuribacterales bacterium]
MNTQIKSHRSHIAYRQVSNWTEAKVKRHLLARYSDRTAILGLLLALLKFRLPFYAKSTAALDDPTIIADCVARGLIDATDLDRAVGVDVS